MSETGPAVGALADFIFLIWEDDGRERTGRPPLVERLAPARERFLAKFGRPPTVVLLPKAEDVAGLDLPTRVYAGVGRRELWLGGPAPGRPASPEVAADAGPTPGVEPATVPSDAVARQLPLWSEP
jgi:hypothetical protein